MSGRLPTDTVCACLDDAGNRTVEIVERCLRCGALMDSDVAKRGEAFDAALSRLNSLYRGEPQEPSTEELAEKIAAAIAEAAIDANEEGRSVLYSELHRADGYLSELVIRAQGHVPNEVLAASEVAREQAEADLERAMTAAEKALGHGDTLALTTTLAQDRASAAEVAREQAEKERDDADTRAGMWHRSAEGFMADRDRLANALDNIANTAQSDGGGSSNLCTCWLGSLTRWHLWWCAAR